jgi:hypothetical protein
MHDCSPEHSAVDDPSVDGAAEDENAGLPLIVPALK